MRKKKIYSHFNTPSPKKLTRKQKPKKIYFLKKCFIWNFLAGWRKTKIIWKIKAKKITLKISFHILF